MMLLSLLQNHQFKLSIFVTVLATRLGPSPQSRTPCQQNFPCCTAHLVWLVLGAREISLRGPPQKCTKNSKGLPLRIFCTFPSREGAPPRILCKICTNLEGGWEGGCGALSKNLPKYIFTNVLHTYYIKIITIKIF